MSIAKPKQRLLKTAIKSAIAFKALLLASVFTSGVFAQELDTAYVPFIVNVNAAVKAQGVGETNSPMSVTANKPDTLIITVAKGGFTSILNGAQTRTNTPTLMSGSNGKISLNLPGQSYKNAEISLYSLNGKRILRAKANASEAAKNISRPNLVAGVYMLSVKGAQGNSFSNRLTHRGGNFNMNVAFGNENITSGSPAAAAKTASNSWTITVSANGYADFSYQFNPVKGINDVQNITLHAVGYDSRLILGDGWAWVGHDPDMGVDMAMVLKNGGAAEGYIGIGILGEWVNMSSIGFQMSWYTGGDKFYQILSAGNIRDTMVSTFTISGNTVTMVDEDGDVITYTKTQVDLSGGDIDPGTGGNLILPAGKAWTNYHEDPYEADGYIFLDGGSVLSINNYFSGDGSWEVDDVGTYTVSDGMLTLADEFLGFEYTLPYSVLDDTLYIGSGFFMMEYSVTDVGNLIMMPLTKPRQADASLINAKAEKKAAKLKNKAKLKLSELFTKK